MNCSLCKKPIEKYNPVFNELKIDDNNTIEICQDCIDKFFKWQQGVYANLFPTNYMKKRFGSKQK